MPEWLHGAFGKDDGISLTVLAVRLAAAFLLGCVVAGIYRLTSGKGRGESLGLVATLVLLTVLISMVTQVIGDNQARAFSLVGALAIIRFRTVVEDTRDTAFVIAAVAVGMAVGAGFMTVPLIGLPFIAVAAFLFRPRPAAVLMPCQDYTLLVRVGAGHTPETLLDETFTKYLAGWRLTATVTARQGAAFDLTYAVRLRRPDAATVLAAELNAREGVQNVELRS